MLGLKAVSEKRFVRHSASGGHLMHLLLGKRQLILAGLAVMLGLAVFVNWYYTGTDRQLSPEGAASITEGTEKSGNAEYVNAEAETQADGDYFASVRMTRNARRDKSTEELKAVLASAGDGTDTAAKASAAIEEIANTASAETNLEGLVSAATGSECVAVISEDSVNVVVSPDALTDGNVLKISDIVSEVCGGKYENIRISAAGN